MTRRTVSPAELLSHADRVSLLNALTRRGFIGTASAVLAAASLAARASAQATPDASPAASPVAGQWPRTVHGSLGDVTIEAKPARVVAVSDWYEVDYLMAQGVKPILYGYTNRWGAGVSPWLVAAGGEELETYDLEGSAEPDLEVIAAANPDLIVADPYIAEQVVSQLNAIAPTVGLPTPYSGSSDWREAQVLTGQATGDEAAAAAAIAETERAIADGRTQLAPYADRTVTIAYTSAYNGGSLFFATDDGQEATLIRELGVRFKGHTDNSPQSMETVNTLQDADILLSFDDEDNQKYLEQNPLFQSLPVAGNGQYQTLSTIASRAIFAPSTLSVRWVIPELVEAIATAAEGKGKKVAG